MSLSLFAVTALLRAREGQSLSSMLMQSKKLVDIPWRAAVVAAAVAAAAVAVDAAADSNSSTTK